MDVDTEEVQILSGQDVSAAVAKVDTLMMRPRLETCQVRVREVQEHFERAKEVGPSWMMLPTQASTE
eukprot:12904670-Prorocentrum_lima.AAC.1